MQPRDSSGAKSTGCTFTGAARGILILSCGGANLTPGIIYQLAFIQNCSWQSKRYPDTNFSPYSSI